VFIILGLLFALSIGVGVLVLFLSPHQAETNTAAQCIDNLHSLTVALKAYAEDHASLLPPVAQPTTLTDLRSGIVSYAPDAVKRWPASDWRRSVLPYLSGQGVFLCPVTKSAFSYNLNSTPTGLDQALVVDKLNYGLLWDVGLREGPGQGPHDGKYAVITLGGTGFATSGRDIVFEKLIFRP
jgi:hypothetical protein